MGSQGLPIWQWPPKAPIPLALAERWAEGREGEARCGCVGSAEPGQEGWQGKKREAKGPRSPAKKARDATA
jgi:hypothetical protein